MTEERTMKLAIRGDKNPLDLVEKCLREQIFARNAPSRA